MKKKYLYNGEYYTESEMNDFAKQSGVSFDNYIAALGKDVKVLDAPYEFKGNFYTQDEISAAAKGKGMKDSDYLSKYGIKKKRRCKYWWSNIFNHCKNWWSSWEFCWPIRKNTKGIPKRNNSNT